MANKKNATRKDGRISMQVYLGRGDDGKRKYKTVYGYTQKEVEQKAREVKLALSKGLDIMNANTPFSELVDAWLISKVGSISDKHYKCLEGKANQIKEVLGKHPVSHISIPQVQSLINEIAKRNPHTHKPSAKKTLVDLKNSVSQVFELAIKNRLTDFNPAEHVIIPSKSPKKNALRIDKR